MTQLVPKRSEAQPHSETQPDNDFLPHVHRIAHLASDKKADGIVAYDVRGLTLIADALVVCSVKSEPQMKAVANAVLKGMREQGVRALHNEGDSSGGWIVLDYGAVIVHIFKTAAREFYDLDGLWADAPRFALDLDE